MRIALAVLFGLLVVGYMAGTVVVAHTNPSALRDWMDLVTNPAALFVVGPFFFILLGFLREDSVGNQDQSESAPAASPLVGRIALELLSRNCRDEVAAELESYFRTRREMYGEKIARRLYYWHVIRTVFLAPIGTIIKAVFPIKLSISTGRSKDSGEE